MRRAGLPKGWIFHLPVFGNDGGIFLIGLSPLLSVLVRISRI
jgi:hypothetical protein